MSAFCVELMTVSINQKELLTKKFFLKTPKIFVCLLVIAILLYDPGISLRFLELRSPTSFLTLA